jgi:hypothetical protein
MREIPIYNVEEIERGLSPAFEDAAKKEVLATTRKEEADEIREIRRTRDEFRQEAEDRRRSNLAIRALKLITEGTTSAEMDDDAEFFDSRAVLRLQRTRERLDEVAEENREEIEKKAKEKARAVRQDALYEAAVAELLELPEAPIKHREAQIARIQRLRGTPGYQILTQIIQADPDLATEIKIVTDRKEEFKTGTAEGDEVHRNLTARLSALYTSARGRRLLDLVIDRAARRESRDLKAELRKGKRYTRELIVGSGYHSTVYSTERQMYFPESPSLVVDGNPVIGGQFGQYENPVFRVNSRGNRPEDPELLHLPGTPGTLNTMEKHAVLQPADLSHESYPDQTVLKRVTKANAFLAERFILEENFVTFRRNPGGEEGKGILEVEFIDPNSGKIDRVLVDRLLLTGLGVEVSGLDESDPETAEILAEEEEVYNSGGTPKVFKFTQFVKTMADQGQPYPLQNLNGYMLSGGGDSAFVAAGITLGYEMPLGKTVIQLDHIEDLPWLGSKFMTKEEFIECTRARYHQVGLEFPRQEIEDYYHRVQPIQGRAVKLRRNGDNIEVIYFLTDEEGELLTDENDQPIERSILRKGIVLAHGFKDEEEETVGRFYEGGLPGVQEIYHPDFSDGPIAVKYPDTEAGPVPVYRMGPRAQLPLTKKERQQSPALDKIPQNSASIFRYARGTRAFANLMARRDLRVKKPRKKDLASLRKADNKVEFNPGEAMAAAYEVKIDKKLAERKLPHDANSRDLLRLSFGEVLYGYSFPDDLQSLTFIVEETGRGADGASFRITVSDSRYNELAEVLTGDELALSVLARLTNPKVNYKEKVQVRVGFQKGRVKVSQIDYSI